MKKLCLLFFIISVCFLLSGCWDRKELSEVQLVSGMAVDLGDNAKYKVTIEALNAVELTSQTSQGNAPSIVEGIEGDSISEITHQFNQYLAQTPIYSHMKLLVISEDVAKLGLMEFIDYLERNRELRDDFKIIIVRDQKAEDVLKITYPFKKASSLKISPQIDNILSEWGGDPNVRINDFISDLTLEGKEPVLETVKIKGDSKKGGSMDNLTKVTPDSVVELDSLAVFKNQKLQGFLPLEDIRSYLLINNYLKQTTVTVNCNSKDNEYSSVRVTQTNTDVQVKWKEGRPVIRVNIKAEGYLEATQCYKSITNIKTYFLYEKLVNKTVSKQVEKTIKKVQEEYQSDIFGFGEMMRRQDYDQFIKVKADWNEHFAEAKVDVNCEITLRRSGIRTKSFLSDT
ncbi:MAG: Ger(x)C family spore germination protein [Bacillus sp. (in: firmicutes)]